MNIDQVDTTEFFVPLPPDEVEKRLAAVTSWFPGWGIPDSFAIGRRTFVGTVKGGKFRLLLRRWRRRNFRPIVEGTIEATAGGSIVRASAAMPWWTRPLGRFTSVASGAGGLAIATLLLVVGRPAAMEPGQYAFLLFLTGVWMPFVAVVLPGFFAAEGVEERKLALDALRGAFAGASPVAAGITDALPTEPVATDAPRPRERESE